ncbi:hypothetical protein KY348_06910 [Candidatus Woesearchaeota archaeon]|nr:hypothetical protein [Candidatus Woesearchaeota archaeon]
MKNLVFIPTYWTFEKEKESSVFDHPMLYSKRGTLGRTLRSFISKKMKHDVLILPVPLHKSIEDKVKHITEKFPKLNIHVFNREDYKKIINELRRLNLTPEFRRHVNVKDYGNVRNMGLIYGLKQGYDNILMIDDDEVVEDDNYFKKAFEGIGLKIKGKPLLGKTGYYIHKNGSYKLTQLNPEIRKFWLKETYINKAIIKAIKHKQRFNHTTIALGGNMVINSELFRKVPFDPYNTRGEDTDYMINAIHSGYLFLMDKLFTIKHLPPKKMKPYWSKLRQDMYRFIYLREKMQYLNVSIRDISPYPAYFLRKNLVRKIIKTNVNYAKANLRIGRYRDCQKYLKNASEILDDAREYAKKSARKYFKFQKEWERYTKKCSKN